MEEKDLNTETSYKTVGNSFQSEKGGFAKSIILPFVSGIVGATLVMGVCFSVPQIKNKIMGEIQTGNTTTVGSGNYTTSSNNLVS